MDSPDIPTNPNVKKEICNQQIFYNYPKKQFLTLEESFLYFTEKFFYTCLKKRNKSCKRKEFLIIAGKAVFRTKNFLFLPEKLIFNTFAKNVKAFYFTCVLNMALLFLC